MMQFECFSKFELDTKKKSLLYFFIRRVVHFHLSFFSKDIIFYIIKLEKLPSIRSFYLQEVHKIIQKYLQVYISIDYFAYSLNHRPFNFPETRSKDPNMARLNRVPPTFNGGTIS